MDKKHKIAFITSELLLITLLIIAIISFIRIVNHNNSLKATKLNMIDNIGEIILKTTVTNNDWTDLPLSENFMEKFRPETGILNDSSIKEAGYDRLIDTVNQIVKLVVYDNRKEDQFWVHYFLNNKNELDDIEIVKHKLSYDENGNEIIYKRTMNEINYIGNIETLADTYHIEYDVYEYINVTDNFLKKHAGGFIRTRDFEWYSVSAIKELCSYEDKIVYLKSEYPKYNENGEMDLFESCDPNLTMYYRVHYYTNDKNWLDDVEVEELSKKEIDKLLAE